MAEPQKKRTPKPRVEPIHCTQIVELWRLVERSQREAAKHAYPDVSEETPEVLRSHLFAYLQQRFFTGLVVRVGKKAVGYVMGDVRVRAFGRPSRYVYVQDMWIDPGFRNQGIGKVLWTEFADRLRKAQVSHFESVQHDTSSFQRAIGAEPVANLLGGKL